MARLIKMLVLFCLSVGGLAGCGGQGESNTAGNTSTVVAYQFTATIDSYDNSIAPFTAVAGDTIYGILKYDPNAIIQKDPSMVQVKIGTTTFNADLNTFTSHIVITNDLDQPLLPGETTPKKSDIFEWTVHDSKLASQYGLSDLQIVISLHDQSGTVFNSSLVPGHLNLSNFNDSSIFLNSNASAFGRAKITSLSLMQ